MNNFEKNWKNSQNSIFRLESRIEYRIPGDWENFEKWKKGTLDTNNSKSWQIWIQLLTSAKTKSVKTQRIRVIPAPLSKYIKFEINLWQNYSAKKSEELFFIKDNEYQKIITESGFNAKDFWLFDDKKLLILNYTKTGQFAGDIIIASESMIKRYRDLKYKLLQESLSMESFLKKLSAGSIS